MGISCAARPLLKEPSGGAAMKKVLSIALAISVAACGEGSVTPGQDDEQQEADFSDLRDDALRARSGVADVVPVETLGVIDWFVDHLTKPGVCTVLRSMKGLEHAYYFAGVSASAYWGASGSGGADIVWDLWDRQT